jgi:hypothetical protein
LKITFFELQSYYNHKGCANRNARRRPVSLFFTSGASYALLGGYRGAKPSFIVTPWKELLAGTGTRPGHNVKGGNGSRILQDGRSCSCCITRTAVFRAASRVTGCFQ